MRYEDVVSAVKQVIHDKGMKQCVVAERDKQIERMKPKEIFADAVSASHTSILVGDMGLFIQQKPSGPDAVCAVLGYIWRRDRIVLTDSGKETSRNGTFGCMNAVQIRRRKKNTAGEEYWTGSG